MDVQIRLLNLQDDLEIIKEAWSWKDRSPKWFRDALEIYKENWEEYMEQFPKELHYGVFVDGEITAIIRLIETQPYTFNLHLEAKRKTPYDVLLQAGLSMRDYLFDKGIYGFYGFIPEINRGVVKLYKDLGFFETDYQNVQGKIRGKDVIWKQYALVNPNLVGNCSEVV